MSWLRFSFLASMLTIASCGGGGGGSGSSVSPPPPPPPPPTNAGGVWEGSTFNDQAGVTFVTIGAVTENNGEARFFNDAGQQFVLSGISGSGGDISATITAIATAGTSFIDGSTISSGTLTGTVVERTSIEGEWSLNTGESGTLTLQYNEVYERGSDLDRLVGFWSDSFGVIYSVEGTGGIFAQDGTGCVYDGESRIINASYNVYRVLLTVSNCPGVNGDYSGIGVLADDRATDDSFIVQMDNGEWIFTDQLLKQ